MIKGKRDSFHRLKIEVPSECYVVEDASDYRGVLNQTLSGIPCQMWTEQSPQTHTRTPENYPNADLGEHNYCRNPDSTSSAWCYTTDPSLRWELCPVGPPSVSCNSPSLTECFEEDDASDYRGAVNETQNGVACQMWTRQSPHVHDRTPSNYPDAGLGDHNFCRNPDGEPSTWCYTIDSGVRWEYCSVGSPSTNCSGEEHVEGSTIPTSTPNITSSSANGLRRTTTNSPSSRSQTSSDSAISSPMSASSSASHVNPCFLSGNDFPCDISNEVCVPTTGDDYECNCKTGFYMAENGTVCKRELVGLNAT
ncbi:plasminogen-like [Diadema setosum]|uniref:plasminogen-like n=1 Tax=Diadema setosum TaxID=31175 RepID=UPI003B3AC312